MPVRRGGLALATVAIAGVYAVPLVGAQLSPAGPDRPTATHSGARQHAPAHVRDRAPSAARHHAPAPGAAALVTAPAARSPRVA